MTLLDVDVDEKELVEPKPVVDALIKQEDALSVYLQSLLGTPVIVEKELEATPKTVSLIKNKEIKAEVATVTNTKGALEKNNSVPQLPDWATAEIKCLSARIGGLTILVPAEYIASILKVTGDLTPSAKMPAWIAELEDNEDEPIQLINTKKLVLGGAKSHAFKPGSNVFAILLDDGSWGLSCDAIGDVVNLKSSEITWRGKSGKRRWLAGTVTSHGAVILDVKKIEKALLG